MAAAFRADDSGPSGAGHDEDRAAIATARAASIASLVERGPASVRLTNVISQVVAANKLPCVTVGEYVDAGNSARAMFMSSLWAFGKGTAAELDALVAAYSAERDIPRRVCADAAGLPPAEVRDAVVTAALPYLLTEPQARSSTSIISA